MSANRFSYENILTFLFLSSVFILAIIKIDDTDTWTHLSFGRWIWEHKAIPDGEPFIHTSKPFPYNNWLFGFLYYTAYHFFNVYGVILLKAVTVTAGFFILIRDSLRPYKNYIAAIIFMSIFVVITRYRFVERPDTFLMVFLPFSIFSLNAFLYDNKKYIYALPVVHMIWANSHASLPLMFIPFIAFIFGGLVQGYLNSRFAVHKSFSIAPTASRLKTVSLIFIASFVMSLISPYFIGQYTYGAQAIASDWWRQEISELQKPTWQTYKAPYIITLAVAVSFVLNWLSAYYSSSSASRLASFISRLNIVHLLLVIPFIVLSFISLRFTFILAITAGPVLIRNISASLEATGVKGQGLRNIYKNKSVIALTAIWIFLYTVLTLTGVKPFGHPKMTFGFGINYAVFPEGVLSYMDKRGIYGKIFNTFQLGGYITWRDFPRRSAFIDGRGFLSEDLLEKTDRAMRNAAILDELEMRHGFESILLQYPIDLQGASELFERDIALAHPDWALVYWDDSYLLYLKRNGRYADVVKEDEYRFIKPANVISYTRSKLHNDEYRLNLINELERNISETGSSKAHAFLGFIYNETGQYKEAIDEFSKVKDAPFISHIIDAYNGMAYAYGRLGDVDESIKYYKKSLSEVEDATTLYNLGTAYSHKGDRKAALKYLERALDMNPDLTSAYPLIIGIYKDLGMEAKAARAKEMFEKAKSAEAGEMHFKEGTKAYLEGRINTAVEELKKSIDINPTNPAAYSNLGYVYYDSGMIEKAFEYQKKALDIDPNFANAHYGLALIYKLWGQRELAKKHWEEYLRIEPSGYYSRKAKEEIELLK